MTGTLPEPWIKAKIGIPEGAALTRGALESYRLRKLQEGAGIRPALGTVGPGKFIRSISIKRTVLDRRKEQLC